MTNVGEYEDPRGVLQLRNPFILIEIAASNPQETSLQHRSDLHILAPRDSSTTDGLRVVAGCAFLFFTTPRPAALAPLHLRPSTAPFGGSAIRASWATKAHPLALHESATTSTGEQHDPTSRSVTR